jgi:hypothetical protein
MNPLKGILSLLGKAREKGLPYSYPSKVQNRAKWMANSDKRRIYNESMAASRKEVDKLVKEGKIHPDSRNESYKRIEQALLKEYDKIHAEKGFLTEADMYKAYDEQLLNEALALASVVGGGTALAAHLVKEPEDAIEEMEEATQTKSDLWGPKVAEGLMDIISPFPRD